MAIVCMVKQEYLSNNALEAVNDNTESGSNMTNITGSFLYSTVENNSSSRDPVVNLSISNWSIYNTQQETDWEKNQDGCHMAFEIIVAEYRGAEFEWSKTIQGGLLSCYFYGYTVALFITGYFTNRLGGKTVAVVAICVSCLTIVILPLCARANVYIVYVLRVITGLAGGTFLSSAYSLISVWAPIQERGRLIAVPMLGSMVGIMATLSSSGLLCAYGFDNGWGSIFYIHGNIYLT
ncbi:hypothetical protein CHS0354_029226 [Potamilus streckersoni]|uniref:Major facilitator superfamily (MFS) profile domain-containing protein n=1 Tax=Potamilus streckersoni TaxID=2493646 RepID=A0AAE0SUL8_9BIVA|nr:hypothetical protein CHS0354_029226 [Potamilus streckersoni]